MELDPEELEGVPSPGDVVVEKYRVDRVLGVGGMGCVVAATHITLGTPVAIKFLLAKAARNPKNIERFKREAQAAARIKSDHVAKVTDVGTIDSGAPYMIMEYLEGEDLAERLTRGGIAIPEACRYVLQACEALAEAHRAGIVHRDLKPANLFLTEQPSGDHRIKVLDFGISKIRAEPGAGADLTKTSALMGSPLYMSPEQMMSAKDADARADIWALGVILHELVTAVPPFMGDTLPEICGKILTAPPTPLAQALPGAPPNLAAVLSRALAKKPEERYPSLAELATALAPFAGPAGQRSADIVCRILGRFPEAERPAESAPTPSHGASSGVGPALVPPTGGGRVTTGDGDTMMAPADPPATSASLTGGGTPAASLPGSAAVSSAPHGAGPGAAAVPSAPHGAGPGAAAVPSAPHGAGPGAASVPGPGLMGSVPGMAAPGLSSTASSPQAAGPLPSPSAMAMGASTAAPVAQTYDGAPAPRRRGLIIAGAAALLAAILVTALTVGRTGRHDAAAGSSNATTEAATPGEGPAGDSPTRDGEVDAVGAGGSEAMAGGGGSKARVGAGGGDAAHRPDDGARAATDHGEAKDGSGTATAPPATADRPTARPKRPRLPRPLRPKQHTVKKGDDLFN